MVHVRVSGYSSSDFSVCLFAQCTGYPTLRGVIPSRHNIRHPVESMLCTVFCNSRAGYAERRHFAAASLDTPPFFDDIDHPVWSMSCAVFCSSRAAYAVGRLFAAASVDTSLVDDIDHPVGSMLYAVFCQFRTSLPERRYFAAASVDTNLSLDVDHGDFDLASSQQIHLFVGLQYTGCLWMSR